MTTILQHQPGQICTILLEVLGKDGYDGYRLDPSALPTVERIIFPALTLASGFPTNMVKISTGLYYFQFTLPTAASSVGTYIVDVKWLAPISNDLQQKAYQIIVTAPFGMYSATIGT